MLDRVYAIKWPLAYREALKYELELKGPLPSQSSLFASLSIVSTQYHHHSMMHHDISCDITRPQCNQMLYCISCRSRDISRIIPFCWLAGLAFIQYHITVIYSQQRSLQKVSHFLPSVSTIASWRSFTILLPLSLSHSFTILNSDITSSTSP